MFGDVNPAARGSASIRKEDSMNAIDLYDLAYALKLAIGVGFVGAVAWIGTGAALDLAEAAWRAR